MNWEPIALRFRKLEPLYREEATGLELSADVLQTQDYIQWFVATNYGQEPSLFQ